MTHRSDLHADSFRSENHVSLNRLCIKVEAGREGSLDRGVRRLDPCRVSGWASHNSMDSLPCDTHIISDYRCFTHLTKVHVVYQSVKIQRETTRGTEGKHSTCYVSVMRLTANEPVVPSRRCVAGERSFRCFLLSSVL